MDFSPIEDLFRERTLKLLLEREATTPDRSEEITSFCGQATSWLERDRLSFRSDLCGGWDVHFSSGGTWQLSQLSAVGI